MGLINVTLPSDGTVADAADINNPINTIVTAVNGNLDNTNLADSAIVTNKLADSAVTSAKLAGGSFMKLFQERTGNSSTGATTPKVPYNGFSGSYTFAAIQNHYYAITLHEPNITAVSGSSTLLFFPTIGGSVVGTMGLCVFNSGYQHGLDATVYWKATSTGTLTLTMQFSSAGSATTYNLGASAEQRAQLTVTELP